MGNCCTRNAINRNNGVFVNLNQTLSPTYQQHQQLNEEDVRMILKRIIYLDYNAKLPEKRKLQQQRKKILDKEIGEEYVKIMEDSKKLELDVYREMKTQVLNDLKIEKDNYEQALPPLNIKTITEEVTKSLLNDIRINKSKLGISKSNVVEIKKNYPTVYDKCHKKLAEIPDIARRLSDLYEEDLFLNYIDAITADTLYNNYKLLPLEIQAFLIDD